MQQDSTDWTTKISVALTLKDRHKSKVKLAWSSNGHLTFLCVIDCWGVHSDARMPVVIISCDVVATHGFSSHNYVTKRSRRKNKEF